MTLKAMVFQGLQNLPVFAGEQKGFFRRRGIDIEFLIAPNSQDLRSGLAEGRHQIAHAGVDNAIAMAEAGADIAVVIGGDNGWNSLIVQPGIGSLFDLRGRTVYVDAPDTAYALVLYRMLALNGLKRGDYRIEAVGATPLRAAAMLRDKTGSATMLNPPSSIAAVKGGLIDMGRAVKAIGPYQASAGFVMRSWAQANAGTLVSYLQAYIEGVRWSLDPRNRDEAIRLLRDRLNLTGEIAAESYALAADPQDGLAKDAQVDIEGLANVLRIRSEFRNTPLPPPEKYLDLSWYRRALDGL